MKIELEYYQNFGTEFYLIWEPIMTCADIAKNSYA